MSEPTGFTRPAAWKNLDDPAPAPADPAAAADGGQPAGKPKRRWFRRRPRHQGLGKASGPDFSWQTMPATTEPSPEPAGSLMPTGASDPALSVAEVRRRQTTRRSARTTRTATSPRPHGARALLILCGMAAFFVFLAVVPRLFGDSDDRRSGPSTPRTTAPTLGSVWQTSPETLRPDLPRAEFVSDVDGTFDEHRLVDAGTTWVVLTGTTDDTQIWVHGMDATTGQERWRHPLDSGLCAADLLAGRLLCAAAIEHDPVTGLGTKWHLALLEPASGKEIRGVDWSGWLTFLHVRDSRALLAEQRQPAPHAVLTGLDSKLQQTWQLDLIDQPEHAGLFSDNRVYNRKLPIPDGPALDRPRIRHVGENLTALWIGQTTAFVDMATGRLVGMPRCSRLVDDGKRLWCNQGPLAAAYSYGLAKLVQTELNTRLAFPDRDPRAGDVTPPVFLKSDGRAVRVDPDTGATVGPLVNSRNGSAFGLVISPRTGFVNPLTLVWDDGALFAVRVATGTQVWQHANPGSLGEPYGWRGRILFAGSTVRLLDPATGETVKSYRQSLGLYTVPVGDVLVAVGPAVLARLVDP